MKNPKELMVEVALLYYKKGLTQQVIADTLNLTRQTVSKLLTTAIEEGIVEITVRNPENEKNELTEKLEKRLTLKLSLQVLVKIR